MEPIRASNSAASSRISWTIRNARSAEAEIDLYDVIGDPYEGVTAKDFIAELRGITANRIILNINSPGGFVDSALAIYDALQRHPAEIVARITVAASAASFIAQAADQRLISKNGKVQIHDAQAFLGIMSVANAETIDELITTLQQAREILSEESDNIAGIYVDKAGGTLEDWRERMKANGPNGTVYRGQEAVDIGLADEVMVAPKKTNELQPLRTVAQAAPEPAPEPIEEIDLDLIPSLANGYVPPLPADFTRLVAANLPASTKGAS